MIDYQPLYDVLREAGAQVWADALPDQLKKSLDPERHGNSKKWHDLINSLSGLKPSLIELDADVVKIGVSTDLNALSPELFIDGLKQFHPWRKGPYELFGVPIDTEWRSDWKWDRLKDHIKPLKYRLVLDVGCGSGYHCWRMLGAGAKMVVGIDPLLLNIMQFQLLRQLYGEAPIYGLPVGIEDVPYGMKAFDTVFSMGVLYHRRSPIDHLLELKECLRPGGELVLETLVIDGGLGQVLVPEDRYARMRNVWFLPSCETLLGWMKRCGFINCRVIDVSVTSIEEQRSTEWMQFHSLKDFLDPDDVNLTSEGYPAPKRAIVLADCPN
ncbi:tRNA 5-methoxyuridine(34)/uridine 5-oxyacetic acid(34) synthase CmoB [Methylicorpusculum sp.]|uniref:tRNA 5-methoxyuridine(34)/uridine 5-oxyacetic acid(34) synthase CmoB n=1 Tax=Methylicorpusculum sp. TaxID=2713644 RepID=UPI00271E7D75|nr:tRNA 5-methoxyuridine(34)/uridine 5-oxyacetic acid(34) synthase CmoB [Methylicorpusculum sp.]MDO8844198.1 tRNA 5-methoxyuridine(34)/uridine 5-oxyacetic acid(34) synthase CmoB [Methylicorpusculum sp.]